jgi:hypothetical protein
MHNGVLSFAVGDLNGDGKLDIAGVERGSRFDPLVKEQVFFTALGTGDGLHYTSVDYRPFSTYGVGGVALADFDKDGKLDAVAVDYDNNRVSVWFGVGAGNVADGPSLSVGSKPRLVYASDFNGDTYPEFAVIDTNAQGDSSRVFVAMQTSH